MTKPERLQSLLFVNILIGLVVLAMLNNISNAVEDLNSRVGFLRSEVRQVEDRVEELPNEIMGLLP